MASLGTIEFEFKPLADKFIQQTDQISQNLQSFQDTEKNINKETTFLNKTLSTTTKVLGATGLAGSIGLLAKHYKVLDKLHPKLSRSFTMLESSATNVTLSMKSLGSSIGSFFKKSMLLFDSRAFRVAFEGGPATLIPKVGALAKSFLTGGVAITAFGAALGTLPGTIGVVGTSMSGLGIGMLNLLSLVGALTSALGVKLRKVAEDLRRSNDLSIASFAQWEKTVFALTATIDGYNKKLGANVINTQKFIELSKQVSSVTGLARQEVAQSSLVLLEFSQNTGLAASQIKDLVERSADYATVTGQDFGTVIQGINNYFRGYSETLATQGINIREADLAQTNYAKSLNRSVQSLTRAQKATAFLEAFVSKTNFTYGKSALIIDNLATGPMTRLVNQQENINIAMGQGAEKIRNGWLRVFTTLQGFITENPLAEFALTSLGAFKELSAVILDLTGMFLSMAGAIATVGVAVKALTFLVGKGGLSRAMSAAGAAGVAYPATIGKAVGAATSIGKFALRSTGVGLGLAAAGGFYSAYQSKKKQQELAKVGTSQLLGADKLQELASKEIARDPSLTIGKATILVQEAIITAEKEREGGFGLPSRAHGLRNALPNLLGIGDWPIRQTGKTGVTGVISRTEGDLDKAIGAAEGQPLVLGHLNTIKKLLPEYKELVSNSKQLNRIMRDPEAAQAAEDMETHFRRLITLINTKSFDDSGLQDIREESHNLQISFAKLSGSLTDIEAQLQSDNVWAETAAAIRTSTQAIIQNTKETRAGTQGHIAYTYALEGVLAEHTKKAAQDQRSYMQALKQQAIADAVKSSIESEIDLLGSLAEARRQHSADIRDNISDLNSQIGLLDVYNEKERSSAEITIQHAQAIRELNKSFRESESLIRLKTSNVENQRQAVRDASADMRPAETESLQRLEADLASTRSRRISEFNERKALIDKEFEYRRVAWKKEHELIIQTGQIIEQTFSDAITEALLGEGPKSAWEGFTAAMEGQWKQTLSAMIQDKLNWEGKVSKNILTEKGGLVDIFKSAAGMVSGLFSGMGAQDAEGAVDVAGTKKEKVGFWEKYGEIAEEGADTAENVILTEQRTQTGYLQQIAANTTAPNVTTNAPTLSEQGAVGNLMSLATGGVSGLSPEQDQIYQQALSLGKSQEEALSAAGVYTPGVPGVSGSISGGFKPGTGLAQTLSGAATKLSFMDKLNSAMGVGSEVLGIGGNIFGGMMSDTAGPAGLIGRLLGFKTEEIALQHSLPARIADTAKLFSKGAAMSAEGAVGGLRGGLQAIKASSLGFKSAAQMTQFNTAKDAWLASGSTAGEAAAGAAAETGATMGARAANIAAGAVNIGLNIIGSMIGNKLAQQIGQQNIQASIGSAIGSIIGQILIPIPVLGAMIGSFLGNLIGGLFGPSEWKQQRRGLQKTFNKQIQVLFDQELLTSPVLGAGGSYGRARYITDVRPAGGSPEASARGIAKHTGVEALGGEFGLYEMKGVSKDVTGFKRGFYVADSLTEILETMGATAETSRKFIVGLTRTLVTDLSEGLEKVNKHFKKWNYNLSGRGGVITRTGVVFAGYVGQIGVLIESFKELHPLVQGVGIAADVTAEKFRRVTTKAIDPGTRSFTEGTQHVATDLSQTVIPDLVAQLESGEISLERALIHFNEKLKLLRFASKDTVIGTLPEIQFGELKITAFKTTLEDIEARLSDFQGSIDVTKSSFANIFAAPTFNATNVIDSFKGMAQALSSQLQTSLTEAFIQTSPMAIAMEGFFETLRTNIRDAIDDDRVLSADEVQGIIANLKTEFANAAGSMGNLIPILKEAWHISQDIGDIFEDVLGDRMQRNLEKLKELYAPYVTGVLQTRERVGELRRDPYRAMASAAAARERLDYQRERVFFKGGEGGVIGAGRIVRKLIESGDLIGAHEQIAKVTGDPSKDFNFENTAKEFINKYPGFKDDWLSNKAIPTITDSLSAGDITNKEAIAKFNEAIDYVNTYRREDVEYGPGEGGSVIPDFDPPIPGPSGLTPEQLFVRLQEYAATVQESYDAAIRSENIISTQKQDNINRHIESLSRESELISRASDLRLRGLNDELDRISSWVNIGKSADSILNRLKEGGLIRGYRPEQRVNELTADIARLLNMFRGEENEQRRASIGDRLIQLEEERLSLSEQVFQRPSSNFQKVLNQTVAELREIRDNAESIGEEERLFNLQLDIADIERETRDATREIGDNLTEYNDQIYDLQISTRDIIDKLGLEYADLFEAIAGGLEVLRDLQTAQLEEQFGEDAANRILNAPLQATAINTQTMVELLENIRDTLAGDTSHPDDPPPVTSDPDPPMVDPTADYNARYAQYQADLKAFNYKHSTANETRGPRNRWYNKEGGGGQHSHPPSGKPQPPSLAEGGFVMAKNLLARLHGPEAVIPLDKMESFITGQGGGTVNVSTHVKIDVSGEMDNAKIDRLTNKVVNEIENSAKHGRLNSIIKERFV